MQESNFGRAKRTRSSEPSGGEPSSTLARGTKVAGNANWYADERDEGATAREDVLGEDGLLLQMRLEQRRRGKNHTSAPSGQVSGPPVEREPKTAQARLKQSQRATLEEAWRMNQAASALGGQGALQQYGLDGTLPQDELGLNNKKSIHLVYNKDCIPPFLADSSDGSFSRTQHLVRPYKDENSDFVRNSRNGSKVVKEAKLIREQKRRLKENLDIKSSDLNKIVHGDEGKDEERLRADGHKEAMRNARNEEERSVLRSQHEKEEIRKLKEQAAFNSAPGVEDEEALQRKREELKPVRERLPIFAKREDLLRSVALNPVNVIVGETGSGKTTQIVQYLYEAGYAKYGMIGCTQPRRMATVSVAERVAEEMGSRIGGLVGYSIRLEDCMSDETKVRFMTEGVLLQEVLHDPLLSKYSVIVMDEAHERNVDTDVLLGVMRDVFRKRADFKLLVTSATMDVERFCEFFGNVPDFKIEGRMFKVEEQYEKTPVEDYVETAVLRAMEIHLHKGPGDILIFMTGQEDINATCEILREKLEECAPRKGEGDRIDVYQLPVDPNDEEGETYEVSVGRTADDLIIIPCYSTLPGHEQRRINEKLPDGKRKCIVATNVAETSLTIEGVVFVIDSGYMQTNLYEPSFGMNSIKMYPVSQAQAKQRRGRAGRTRKGVCIRLYTEHQHFNELLQVSVPGIQRTSVDSVVLLLKSIGKNDLLQFDFIDPPPEESIKSSMKHLWMLGALDNMGHLTSEGRMLADLPCEPVLGKLLVASSSLECSEEMLSIVAMMAADPQARRVFILPRGEENTAMSFREHMSNSESDHLTLLNIMRQFQASGCSLSWAREHYLDGSIILRGLESRTQFRDRLKRIGLSIQSCEGDDDLVRKCIASAYFAQTAKRQSQGEYQTLLNYVTCLLHPTSALHSGSLAEYVVYNDFTLTKGDHPYMMTVTKVEPDWIVEYSQGIISEIGDEQAAHRALIAKATAQATQAVEKERKAAAVIPTRETGQKEREKKMARRKKQGM